MQSFPTRIFFLFSLALVVVGSLAVIYGIRSLAGAKASVDWPSTQGKVVESAVGRHGAGTDKGYHAEILYEFSVKGTTFTGDRVAYGDHGSSNPGGYPDRVVARYPKGKRVTVYYMPGNPKECLLEPGLNLQTWILTGFGVALLMSGGLIAAICRHQERQEITEPGVERERAITPVLKP